MLLTDDNARDGAGDPDRRPPPRALPRLRLLLRLRGQDDVLAAAPGRVPYGQSKEERKSI